MKKIAIVRIAGEHGLIVDVKTTLKLLNLHKKNPSVSSSKNYGSHSKPYS